MNITYALRDLWKQRTRTILGIVGIGISIFLLTAVGMLGDSIAYSYVDYASQERGKVDYMVHSSIPINYAAVESQITSDSNLNAILTDFLPRSRVGPSSQKVVRSLVNTRNNQSGPVSYVGVDIEKENAAAQGSFLLLNGTPFTGTLGPDECLVPEEMAIRLSIKTGDQVIYNITTYKDDERRIVDSVTTANYTVKAVINPNFKIPDGWARSIIVDLDTFNTFWGQLNGSCSILIINLKNPEAYYNAKDLDGTILKVRNVGIQIQNRLGFYNNYWDNSTYQHDEYKISIWMPRVDILEIEQYINVGISIILLFVTILGVVISGVLINGILTTAVEEKIREFGVFRVLGAHRVLPIKLTVTQATIISSIGTAAGMVGGYFVVSTALIPLITEIANFPLAQARAIMSVETFAIAIAVGVGVSMLVGLAPAMKAARMSILGAINPYRQEKAGTRMVREQNINLQYIIVGTVISVIAAFVLFIVPQIILTLDLGLIVAVLVILLSVFLLGATLVGLGFLPVVQRVVTALFTSLSRKTREIIKISLVRYNRRNVTTVIMFSISFSFITLVSTVLRTQSAQNIGTIRNNNGSDLVIDSRNTWISSWSPSSTYKIPDQDLARELLNFPGIARTSTILATDRELDTIRGSQHTLTLLDLVRYKSFDVHGIAIDENYLDTVYTEYILFSQGSVTQAFTELFNGSNTVIISSGLGQSMGVRLGDKVLLSFQWGKNDEVDYEEFTIVGMVDNLPGVPTVEKRAVQGDGAAVILSQENFKKYFQLPVGNYYTSMIFIKLTQEYATRDASTALELEILDTYEDTYLFDMDNSFREGQFARDVFGYVEMLFLLILTFAVIISLFGLASSAYSTILERTREVGIIETLGLKKRQVKSMFTIESEIIMISAAINGAIVGIILTFLFYWQIAAFSSYPVMASYSIPFDIIGIELVVATIACFVAMQFLVRRIQKLELMEIFRITM